MAPKIFVGKALYASRHSSRLRVLITRCGHFMSHTSDTSAGTSLVHPSSLRAVEDVLQDQISALQLRVTALEFRLQPRYGPPSSASQDSSFSAETQPHFERLFHASVITATVWEFLHSEHRRALLHASWFLRTGVDAQLLRAAILQGWPRQMPPPHQRNQLPRTIRGWLQEGMVCCLRRER